MGCYCCVFPSRLPDGSGPRTPQMDAAVAAHQHLRFISYACVCKAGYGYRTLTGSRRRSYCWFFFVVGINTLSFTFLPKEKKQQQKETPPPPLKTWSHHRWLSKLVSRWVWRQKKMATTGFLLLICWLSYRHRIRILCPEGKTVFRDDLKQTHYYSEP